MSEKSANPRPLSKAQIEATMHRLKYRYDERIRNKDER
jgi:hypothetical protein